MVKYVFDFQKLSRNPFCNDSQGSDSNVIFRSMRKGKSVPLPDEMVISKIYLVRGQKVMLDKDLADLYRVETRR